MKPIIALIITCLLCGCAVTQITIKAPKGAEGPTIGSDSISVQSEAGFNYKSTDDSKGSINEAGGATADISGTGL